MTTFKHYFIKEKNNELIQCEWNQFRQKKPQYVTPFQNRNCYFLKIENGFKIFTKRVVYS